MAWWREIFKPWIIKLEPWSVDYTGLPIILRNRRLLNLKRIFNSLIICVTGSFNSVFKLPRKLMIYINIAYTKNSVNVIIPIHSISLSMCLYSVYLARYLCIHLSMYLSTCIHITSLIQSSMYLLSIYVIMYLCIFVYM